MGCEVCDHCGEYWEYDDITPYEGKQDKYKEMLFCPDCMEDILQNEEEKKNE